MQVSAKLPKCRCVVVLKLSLLGSTTGGLRLDAEGKILRIVSFNDPVPDRHS